MLIPLMLIAAVGAVAEERPARRIVVSIPDRKLALVEDGRLLKVYATAVGASQTPSPAGSYTIVNRIPSPTYYAPGRAVLSGKANPLGTRWLGLSRKSLGIHGTNVPSSIGRAASHGCIRMRNRDVEDLFERVQVGDVVEIHDRHTEELVRLFGPAPVEAPTGAALAAGVE
jgi:lipoprotein-anchoring transpeptidase ErfK/SrfK